MLTLRLILLLSILSCSFTFTFSLRNLKPSLQKSNSFNLPKSADAAPRVNDWELNAGAASIQAAAAPMISPITAASLRAISKLMSTVGIGGWASKKGLLDKNALSVLSKLVFSLLQPCMLFVNVADTVSKAQGGVTTWLLPLAAATQIALGFTLGSILTKLIYGPDANEDDKRQTLTGTTFGNSGPLPFVFVDALLRNHPDPTLLPAANAYISLYLLGWSPLFWIFAPSTLGGQDKISGTPAQKRAALIKRIFSPPVVGSLMGLVVGSVPFLRNLIVHKSGLLNPVKEAMRTLGNGYLPAVVLVLAGSLFPSEPPKATEESVVEAKDKLMGVNKSFLKQIASIYFARFFLLPSAGFFLVKYLQTKIPFLASALSDPVLVLVLLIECCMPSAQNSTVIYTLQGRNGLAARMARVLMTVYVLGVPAITYWLGQALKIVPAMVA